MMKMLTVMTVMMYLGSTHARVGQSILAPKGDGPERSAFADPESEEEFDFEEAAANHDAMMEGPKKKDGLEKNPKGKPSRGAAAGIYNQKGENADANYIPLADANEDKDIFLNRQFIVNNQPLGGPDQQPNWWTGKAHASNSKDNKIRQQRNNENCLQDPAYCKAQAEDDATTTDKHGKSHAGDKMVYMGRESFDVEVDAGADNNKADCAEYYGQGDQMWTCTLPDAVFGPCECVGRGWWQIDGTKFGPHNAGSSIEKADGGAADAEWSKLVDGLVVVDEEDMFTDLDRNALVVNDEEDVQDMLADLD